MCVLYILRKYSKLLIVSVQLLKYIYNRYNRERLEYREEIRKQASEFGNRFWQVGPCSNGTDAIEKRGKQKKEQNKKKKGEKAVNKRRRNEERESGGGKEIELTEEKRRTTDVANERKLVQTRGSREEERERS